MDFITPEILSYFGNAVFGIVFAIGGTKYRDITKAFKTLMAALEDDKLTAEEIKKIVISFKAII
jgi:undecaprenyl pyrophosphate synthase